MPVPPPTPGPRAGAMQVKQTEDRATREKQIETYQHQMSNSNVWFKFGYILYLGQATENLYKSEKEQEL